MFRCILTNVLAVDIYACDYFKFKCINLCKLAAILWSGGSYLKKEKKETSCVI